VAEDKKIRQVVITDATKTMGKFSSSAITVIHSAQNVKPKSETEQNARAGI
jgi:hypothetical protein